MCDKAFYKSLQIVLQMISLKLYYGLVIKPVKYGIIFFSRTLIYTVYFGSIRLHVNNELWMRILCFLSYIILINRNKN